MNYQRYYLNNYYKIIEKKNIIYDLDKIFNWLSINEKIISIMKTNCKTRDLFNIDE